jgi:hypothetical protein
VIREFATFRLPKELKARCVAMADKERRPLSKMMEILVEEAIQARRGGCQSQAESFLESLKSLGRPGINSEDKA